MKERNWRNIVTTIASLICIVLVQIPWFIVNGKRYNLYTAYFYLKRTGISGVSEEMASLWDGNIMALKIPLMMWIVFELALAGYIISIIMHKKWYLDIVALAAGYGAVQFNSAGMSNVADNMMGSMYGIIIVGISAAGFLIGKMIDIWDDTMREANRASQKEKEAKIERKRRLYFPGKYTRLFYQIVWKNFCYDWKDYSLLLVSGAAVGTLAFAGIGSYQILSKTHCTEGILNGEGLEQILFNAMIPLGICAIFLMTFILIFYLKKWVQSYSIFVTLGIRKKALYIVIILEILMGFIWSYVTGILLGNGLIFLLRKVICRILGNNIVLGEIGCQTYVEMLGALLVVYLVALMATRDIVSDLNLVSASAKEIAREKMPRKGTKVLTFVGAVICIWSVLEYRYIYNYEKVSLLGLLFVGLFLSFRFGGAVYLRYNRRQKKYLYGMLEKNQQYHKSKTTAWYFLALSVLHVCTIFYFTFQVTSMQIAEDENELYPYDFVCVADRNDDALFDKIKETYGAEIREFPMVRIANADKTEQTESAVHQMIPQGQQIGISETTYRKLSEMNGRTVKKSPGLDAAGKKVYLVHQQDRSVKAQPLDWFSKKEPILHVGLPCEGYKVLKHRDTYFKRKIVGEEFGSLIGTFCQGKLENLVVFSDTYFKEAQKAWKYTNIYSGDIVEKNMRIEGSTIEEGPTELVLINVKKSEVDVVEEELRNLDKTHESWLKYDSQISCCYDKKTAVIDWETEYMLKLIINVTMILAMLLISMFLMVIKMLSEMHEKKMRAEFLKCMGMQRKERIRLLKKEIYLFYKLPILVSMIVTVYFTLATFRARMYGFSVRIAYLKNAMWIWGIYFLIQILFAKSLSQFVIRRVEEKDE